MGRPLSFGLLGRLLVLVLGLVVLETKGVLGQDRRHRRPRGDNILARENKRPYYLALFGGGATGFILSGWSLRSKNRKLKDKYEKEFKAQQKRIDDAIRHMQLQYHEYLEKKHDEYVEKYKHLQYLENALMEAGIPLDLSLSSGNERLQTDYEEFRQPDVNGDNKISRKEFNDYMRKYLKENPEYSQYDYPTFEEFDRNRDGTVTFEEWQDYIYQAEKAAAAQEQYYQQQQQAVRGKGGRGGR